MNRLKLKPFAYLLDKPDKSSFNEPKISQKRPIQIGQNRI
jgi:hypothetical protein